MTSRISLALFAAVVFVAPALAQDNSGGVSLGKQDTNAPINVSADTFVGDMKTKVGTYIGNVIVVQGDMKMRADKMSVFEVDNKPDHISAWGNILLTSTSGNASGDTGVYDLNTKNVTLDGKVILTKDKNVMRGTHLVYNLTTGKSQLVAKGATGTGGRVTGVFVQEPKTQPGKPQSQTKSKPPAK